MSSSSKNTTSLALYYYDACPFCAQTRRAINSLDVDVELKNIQLDPQNRADLVQGGGKKQVPCLRIEQAKGNVQWLYESSDIIKYLSK